VALFECEECGHQVSDKAQACPGCGAPVKRHTARSASAGKRSEDDEERRWAEWAAAESRAEKEAVEVYHFEPPPKKRSVKERSAKSGCLTVLGVVMLLAFVGSLSNRPKTSSQRETSTPPTMSSNRSRSHSAAAQVVCQNLVENSLKAPSTASFPWFSTEVRQSGPDTYTVSGYVDAENSFGAKIRSAWTCQIAYKGGDDVDWRSWDVLHLDIR
jgi:hypothetical protein